MIVCFTKVSYWGQKHILCLHISKSPSVIPFFRKYAKTYSTENHPSVMSQRELLPLTGYRPQQSAWAGHCKQTVGVFLFVFSKLSNCILANLKMNFDLDESRSYTCEIIWAVTGRVNHRVNNILATRWCHSNTLSYSTTYFHPGI